MIPTIDPKLDLVLERTADVPRHLVWRAWTEPEYLMKWFCPLPWKTVECELDLRPGGKFYTRMRGPEGEDFPGTGCFLEVVKNERLVWTSTMLPGYRPQIVQNPDADMPFTAFILLSDHGSGTKYTAVTVHRDEKGKNQHETMGFHKGWGAAFDQLVEMIASGNGPR